MVSILRVLKLKIRMLDCISYSLGGQPLLGPRNTTIFLALQSVGLHFSRFCFHEHLFVAGNCRACLLEIKNFEKPVPACVADLEQGQSL